VLSPPDSPRGKLMQRYVCLRIVRMDSVDIGLFDYDRYNTLYFFMLNADEQIYMRYGGRDTSQDTYLSLESLELALAKGLELHEQYKSGKLAKTQRPAPAFAKDIPLLVERTFARNNCVECHLIGDFTLQHKELEGKLDKPQDMFRPADIRAAGIHLDVPKGLLVKEATGAMAEAGLRAGDTIAALNGTPLWTFGDLQHHYDKLPRATGTIDLGIVRDGKTQTLKVRLPKLWWFSDIRYKQLTVDPRVFFETRPPTPEEVRRHGLEPEGFAGVVKYVSGTAKTLKLHDLQIGDIVTAVNGKSNDAVANTPELFIRLHTSAGDAVELDYIRGGQRAKMELKTSRIAFRK
jgi:hypothetical protein